MREKIVKLYKFDELSERAQDKAIQELWDINVDSSYWFESTIEDIKELGETSSLGCTYGGEFDCDRASYVSIENCNTTVTALVASSERVRIEYPNVYKEVIAPFIWIFTGKELRQIARLERSDLLGSLSGETSKQRRGIRAYVERYDTSQTPRVGKLIDKVETAWEELLRDLEHCYLTMLRNEYEYQTSEEQIKESIRANEYEFTEDGSLD